MKCLPYGIRFIFLCERRDLTRAAATAAWSLAVTTVHRTVALYRSSFKPRFFDKKNEPTLMCELVFGARDGT